MHWGSGFGLRFVLFVLVSGLGIPLGFLVRVSGLGFLVWGFWFGFQV